MALQFLQLFAPNQVDNAAPDTLFTMVTTPANAILRNARVRFANTTAGAVTVQAWAVPSAGAANDTTVFLPTVSIAANSYIDVDVPVIAAGGTIRAQAGAANSITATAIDGFIQT